MSKANVLIGSWLLALLCLVVPLAALAGNPLIITFGQPTIYTVGNVPSSVAIADLTGDGKQDLVVTNRATAR